MLYFSIYLYIFLSPLALTALRPRALNPGGLPPWGLRLLGTLLF